MLLFRFLDILFATVGLVFFSPILLFISVCIYLDTRSMPLYFQTRLGRYQKPFVLIKFRTMRPETASMSTHLVSKSALTATGKYLRISKLDELPQLWNVIRGDMSIVGPRPCLPVQKQLISERQILDVFSVLPGITGLSQIRGIDMSTPKLLAQTDFMMVKHFSLKYYFLYILLTFKGQGIGDPIQK